VLSTSRSRELKDRREEVVAAEPEADPERDQRTVFAYQVPFPTRSHHWNFFNHWIPSMISHWFQFPAKNSFSVTQSWAFFGIPVLFMLWDLPYVHMVLEHWLVACGMWLFGPPMNFVCKNCEQREGSQFCLICEFWHTVKLRGDGTLKNMLTNAYVSL
jgi:hypothetical protein